MADFSIESTLSGFIAGVDEAGRGPWAGPVVAAAVVINKDLIDIDSGINDSKKVSKKNREFLFDKIISTSHFGVGITSVENIDKLNILEATKLAMVDAINQINLKLDYVLVDGNQLPQSLPCPAQAVIKGDSKSISIAAASIIAKVTRDRIMEKLHKEFPVYGWNSNSGYGTKDHIEAIARHGICIHHRKSYAPIRKILQQNELLTASV